MELKGGDKLKAKLEEIARSMGGGSVRVGFLEDAKYPDGTPVAAVAFWNEFGKVGQPPRPFFRQMIAKESGDWADVMASQAKATDFNGPVVLGRMGELIKGQLQQSINEFESPALSPKTIAKKGFEKPLIDTGHMLNSVAYEVRDEPAGNS